VKPRYVTEAETLGAALHTAVVHGGVDDVKKVLKLGADVDYRDKGGGTPLLRAVARGAAEIAKFLLDHDADIEASYPGGNTPLMAAVEAGHKEMIEMLLSRKADINARSENGYTAVIRAAMNNLQAMGILLKAGADINAQDSLGQTPLMLAIENPLSEPDDVSTVLSAGPDLEITDEEGNTALHYAVKKGSKKIIRLLVEAGADISAENAQGQKPEDVADDGGLKAVFNALREAALEQELRVFSDGLSRPIKATKPLAMRGA